MPYRIPPLIRTYKDVAFCRLNPTTTIFDESLSLQHQCKIRIMILSDTHGNDLRDVSLPRADVVLHCGDLTNDSRSAELERTLTMLRAIRAPLKLIIPGNHDFRLEPGYWRRTRAHSRLTQQQRQDKSSMPTQTISEPEDDADLKNSWGLLRRAARYDNIFLLPQGTHTFVVRPDTGVVGRNGARLRLFASPLTPRQGNWGFQYDRSNPHRWDIPQMKMPNGDGAVDVVMTHGPPRGIRDGTGTVMGRGGLAAGAGCSGLLAAIERARPRIHCFGHIHGAWGAEIVTWNRKIVSSGAQGAPGAFLGLNAPTYSNLVDAQRSRVVASLMTAPTSTTATDAGEHSLGPSPSRTIQRHRSGPREEGHCYAVAICPDGKHAVEPGTQTLFVNAAVELRSKPPRKPWLVDIDLPVATKEDAAVATETMHRLLL